MKTRYKIPIIVGMAFVAIWPQVPHIFWIGCEILSDCSNELSYASGIVVFGESIDTNLFDIHEETPLGYFMLAASFASMGSLILWRVRK